MVGYIMGKGEPQKSLPEMSKASMEESRRRNMKAGTEMRRLRFSVRVTRIGNVVTDEGEEFKKFGDEELGKLNRHPGKFGGKL